MRRSPDRLHTSSDGQKFEVRADFRKTTRARGRQDWSTEKAPAQRAENCNAAAINSAGHNFASQRRDDREGIDAVADGFIDLVRDIDLSIATQLEPMGSMKGWWRPADTSDSWRPSARSVSSADREWPKDLQTAGRADSH